MPKIDDFGRVLAAHPPTKAGQLPAWRPKPNPAASAVLAQGVYDAPAPATEALHRAWRISSGAAQLGAPAPPDRREPGPIPVSRGCGRMGWRRGDPDVPGRGARRRRTETRDGGEPSSTPKVPLGGPRCSGHAPVAAADPRRSGRPTLGRDGASTLDLPRAPAAELLEQICLHTRPQLTWCEIRGEMCSPTSNHISWSARRDTRSFAGSSQPR